MKPFKAAVIQHACTENTENNIKKSVELIRSAASQGAEFIGLSELHKSLYFCQIEDSRNFDLAESIPGESTEIFSQLAKELKIVICTSLFEKRAPGLYHNTAVVFDKDGRIAGKYRKMHIPDDPGYYEKYYFTPGDLGFQPIQTSLGKIGVLICWDQWYPEAARLMAMNGADILFYPTAIGWETSDQQDEKDRQLGAWITIQRSHAVANGLYVLSANRIGFESNPEGHGSAGIDFWGNSFICGPQGQILQQAGSDKEQIVIQDIDLSDVEKVRRIWPYFRDRRIDCYSGLTNRFGNP